MSDPKRVFVVGVGMTKFEKPGKRDWDYPKMAQVATKQALADAGVAYEEIEQVMVGYVYGDSTCGQRAIYEVGLTGVPVLNVNNNCATGSSALYLARQFVRGGLSECVLALGFEKMERGSLGAKFNDRTNPMELHMTAMISNRGFEAAPPAPQIFGNAAREHQEKYGTKAETFAKIAEKNHRHSANNPYSQFRDVYTLEQISGSREIFAPLTKLQCCPTSDGAAAAVVCSEAFVLKHGLQAQAIEIAGMGFTTDTRGAFGDSSMSTAGYDMSVAAAKQAYGEAGIRGAADCQVVELHDCFSANELITYEALGLCAPGGAQKLVDDGDVTFGGRWVVNPSGGLISKGHPLGATGLAQVAELSWQLRRMATNRQVPNLRYALQHNIGLGGAAIVSVLKLGFPEAARPFTGARNPAMEIDPEEPTHPNNASAKL